MDNLISLLLCAFHGYLCDIMTALLMMSSAFDYYSGFCICLPYLQGTTKNHIRNGDKFTAEMSENCQIHGKITASRLEPIGTGEKYLHIMQNQQKCHPN